MNFKIKSLITGILILGVLVLFSGCQWFWYDDWHRGHHHHYYRHGHH